MAWCGRQLATLARSLLLLLWNLTAACINAVALLPPWLIHSFDNVPIAVCPLIQFLLPLIFPFSPSCPLFPICIMTYNNTIQFQVLGNAHKDLMDGYRSVISTVSFFISYTANSIKIACQCFLHACLSKFCCHSLNDVLLHFARSLRFSLIWMSLPKYLWNKFVNFLISLNAKVSWNRQECDPVLCSLVYCHCFEDWILDMPQMKLKCRDRTLEIRTWIILVCSVHSEAMKTVRKLIYRI